MMKIPFLLQNQVILPGAYLLGIFILNIIFCQLKNFSPKVSFIDNT